MADLEAGSGTSAVWAGEQRAIGGAPTQTSVVLSVSFGYEETDDWLAVATEASPGHIYTRNTNPTVAVFEEKVRVLEGAEAATSASTGMAAIASVLYSLVESGMRVVSVKDTYGGTNKILSQYLPRYGIEVHLCDTDDHEQIETSIRDGCDVLYLETPTNPTLKVLDIRQLAEAGHSLGAVVVVDNTVATPINQSPLALGADLVIHSGTKYLGGHADALGGVVAGRRELVEKAFRHREIHGAALDPFSAYLLIRGMKTLHLRVQCQNANAQAVSDYLVGHRAVTIVNYPGNPEHPAHDIASRQMSGFGGMLSFGLEGGFDAVQRFLPSLRYSHAAANLGAVETVIGPPATTSHVELTAAERAKLGIPEGLIRYSAGIENADDLIGDLDQALARL